MSQEKTSPISTIMASLVIVLSYLVCFLIIAPVLLWLYDTLFGSWHALGNPSIQDARDNPTFFSLLVRLALSSGVSAYAAASLVSKIFTRAHGRTVATVFGFALAIWLVLAIMKTIYDPEYGLIIEIFIIGATFIPSAMIAQAIWRHNFLSR